MAHPHEDHKAHKVERRRVGHITRGYASGGAVSDMHDSPSKPGETKKAYKKRDAQVIEGGSRKERLDRPGRAMRNAGGAVNRAKGGRVGKKGTNVNVIIAPQGGHPAPQMTPAAGGAAAPPSPSPAPPPRPMPPAMPGPGAMPPGGGPMPMPPRHSGGRAYAKGGAVKSGPAWSEGLKNGTPVQNNPSGKSDQRDVNRGKPVTYATGGAVEAPRGKTAGRAPRLDGGAGGGTARMEKAKRAASGYARPK